MGGDMRNLKKDIIAFCDRWKHLLLLLYFIVYLVWFAYCERTVTTRFHVIHVALDDYIPFCEFFVVPYFLWFLYVAWGVIYTALHEKKDYYRLCAFLFTGMTLFLIISTLYPNGHHLRPYYFERNNIFCQMCRALYATDTATNLFPSIHVYNSIGVHAFVMNCEAFKKRKGVRIASFILCVSIILATVFIKQHSLFDVATAFVCAYVMYYLVYVREWAKSPVASKAGVSPAKKAHVPH